MSVAIQVEEEEKPVIISSDSPSNLKTIIHQYLTNCEWFSLVGLIKRDIKNLKEWR